MFIQKSIAAIYPAIKRGWKVLYTWSFVAGKTSKKHSLWISKWHVWVLEATCCFNRYLIILNGLGKRRWMNTCSPELLPNSRRFSRNGESTQQKLHAGAAGESNDRSTTSRIHQVAVAVAKSALHEVSGFWSPWIWWTQRDAESRLSVMLLSLAKTTAWSHHRKHHCDKYRVCTCRLLEDLLKMRCSHKSCPAGMQPPCLNWAAAKNKLSTNEEMQARVRSIFFWSLSTWLHSGSFFPTRF